MIPIQETVSDCPRFADPARTNTAPGTTAFAPRPLRRTRIPDGALHDLGDSPLDTTGGRSRA